MWFWAYLWAFVALEFKELSFYVIVLDREADVI